MTFTSTLILVMTLLSAMKCFVSKLFCVFRLRSALMFVLKPGSWRSSPLPAQTAGTPRETAELQSWAASGSDACHPESSLQSNGSRRGVSSEQQSGCRSSTDIRGSFIIKARLHCLKNVFTSLFSSWSSTSTLQT